MEDKNLYDITDVLSSKVILLAKKRHCISEKKLRRNIFCLHLITRLHSKNLDNPQFFFKEPSDLS